VTTAIDLITLEKLAGRFMEGQETGSQGIKGREDNLMVEVEKGNPTNFTLTVDQLEALQ